LVNFGRNGIHQIDRRTDRASKSEDRVLSTSGDPGVAEDRPRARSVDVTRKTTELNLKSDFFHKLVAKAALDDDDEADTVQYSLASLDAKESDKASSTSSLDVDAQLKMTEVSRSNTSLDKGVFTLSVASCCQRQATMDRIASNFVARLRATEFSLFVFL
jgi:hypothetical protein